MHLSESGNKKLAVGFYEALKDEKLLHIYEVFEKPMINILAKMEIHGIKIDNREEDSGK